MIPANLLEDENTAHVVRPLTVLAGIGCLLSLGYMLVWLFILPQSPVQNGIALLWFVPNGLALLLIRWKQVWLARNVLLGGLWLLTTLSILTIGETTIPLLSAYILTVILAALLSPWRLVLGYVILTTTTEFLLAVAGLGGTIPFATAIKNWLSSAILMLLVTGIVYIMHHRNLQNLHRTQDALAEREKLQQKLAASEERYRRVSELTSDYAYSYRVDPDKTYHLEWLTEDSFYRIMGIRREEFDNDTFSSFHPEDGPQVQQDIEKVLDGQIIQNEYRFLDKTGTLHWLHIARYPVWDADEGRVVRFYGVVKDITERKQAEAAQQAHEQRYKGLFEQTHDAVFIVNLEGIFVDVNQRGIHMLGYTAEELIGQSVGIIVGHSDKDAAATIFKSLIAGEILPVYDRIFRKKSGEEFPVEINAMLVRDPNGEPLHIQSVVRDITERKRTDQALRESEERYRRVSELTSDYAYSYRVDPDKTYHLEWLTEDSFYRMTGIQREEFEQTISLYHPEDMALLQEDMQQVLAGEPTQREYRIFTKTGATRWVHISRYPVWDADEERVVHFYGAVKDITERKEAEIARQTHEQRYKGLFEQTHDAVFIFSLDGFFLAVNQQAAIMSGWTVEELIGQPVEIVVGLSDQKNSLVVRDALKAGKIIPVYERIFRKKNGEEFPVEINISLVKDPNGEPLHFQSVVRDITERTKARQAILDLNTTLKNQANQLTTLNQIAQDISALTGLSTTLKRTLIKLQETLPLDVFYVALHDPTTNTITFPIMYDNEQFWQQEPISFEEAGLNAQVLQTGQPLLVNRTLEEIEADDAIDNRLGDLGKISGSILMAPLPIGDKNIGVISIQSYTPNRYHTQHFDLLQGAGYQIAIAVENARLYDSLRSELVERQRLEAELQKYANRLEHLVDERTNTLRQTKEQLELVLNNTTNALAFADASGDILVTNPAFRATFSERGTQAVELILWALADDKQREKLGNALLKVLYDNEGQRVEAQIISGEGQEKDIDLTLIPVQTTTGNKRNGVLVSGHDITQIKEIERFKERFVADAVHDLATPITGLSTRLYLLQRNPEKLADHARALENQVQHLRNLLEDLRTLSRMDRGQLKLNKTLYDIGDLVQRVFDTYEPVAIDKHQSLELRISQALPELDLDQSQIERVLVNLVSNAINYTPKDKTIRLETAIQDQAVVIQVTDQGIGIAEEDLPHVFERFYRTKEARARLLSGTGLGLAITKEIVELHGGSISVSSQPGQGSTFTIQLPLPPVN